MFSPKFFPTRFYSRRYFAAQPFSIFVTNHASWNTDAQATNSVSLLANDTVAANDTLLALFSGTKMVMVAKLATWKLLTHITQQANSLWCGTVNSDIAADSRYDVTQNANNNVLIVAKLDAVANYCENLASHTRVAVDATGLVTWAIRQNIQMVANSFWDGNEEARTPIQINYTVNQTVDKHVLTTSQSTIATHSSFSTSYPTASVTYQTMLSQWVIQEAVLAATTDGAYFIFVFGEDPFGANF